MGLFAFFVIMDAVCCGCYGHYPAVICSHYVVNQGYIFGSDAITLTVISTFLPFKYFVLLALRYLYKVLEDSCCFPSIMLHLANLNDCSCSFSLMTV